MGLKHSKFERFYMFVDGTLSAGDGQAWAVVPFSSGTVHKIDAAVAANGGTSGDTSVQVARVRDGGTPADLLSSTIDLAHDAAAHSGDADAGTLQNRNVQKGDLFRLDIDSVPGTASTDLAVCVTVKINYDSEL